MKRTAFGAGYVGPVTGACLADAGHEVVCVDVDALVICTEWKSFRAPDFAKLAQAMTAKLIFEGRNFYDPSALARNDWQYYAIGRSLTARAAA